MNIEEIMRAYIKLGKPGTQHKLLEKMSGSWETKIKNWPEPGITPMESTGSSKISMIMGGRFLQEEFSGIMMGNQFYGLGITGFDNHEEKYESIWLDSSSTSILVFNGNVSQDNKKLTMESSHAGALKGAMKWRSVTTFIDENKHLFEMFNITNNDKIEKNMEISYTRRK